MKIFIIFLLTVFSIKNSNSEVIFDIIGPCSETPIIRKSLPFSPQNSVGKLTIETLDQENIPFVGAEEGIKTIYSIPEKENEILILSDNELLAYGWCYKVNGLAPELYPHRVEVSDGDHIEWYFAFSRNLNGEWVSQCKPSYLEQRTEFCSN